MPSVELTDEECASLCDRWADATRMCCSLSPVSSRVLSLDVLLLEVREEVKGSIARGMVDLAEASRVYFPENIFFDGRYLAERMSLSSMLEEDAEGWLEEVFGLLEELFALFGNGTPIRFRYVHDFLYGYDWSRWIQKHPEDGRWHPYSLEFLGIMLRRGHEIIRAIEVEDEVYPPLAAGVHRNRFGFNREPEKERVLFRAMAEQGMIPLSAWGAGDVDLSREDYHAVREAWALEGLAGSGGVEGVSCL